VIGNVKELNAGREMPRAILMRKETLCAQRLQMSLLDKLIVRLPKQNILKLTNAQQRDLQENHNRPMFLIAILFVATYQAHSLRKTKILPRPKFRLNYRWTIFRLLGLW
jgi:hypothetical protein